MNHARSRSIPILLWVTAFLGCVAGAPLTRAAFLPISIQPETRNRDLPIIDAHNHLNGNMSGEQLLRLMDEAGVRRMVLMARYYRGEADPLGSDEQALAIARRYPGRFIPFVGGQRGELARASAWMNVGTTRMLAEAATGLRSGEYFGLGEFILRHHDYGIPGVVPPGYGEIDIPPDTPLMRSLVDIAAKYGAPVLIHAEAEPHVVPGVEAILQHQPKTSVIWAHSCGRNSAKAIRELLAKHSNLYCDLASMMRQGGYGRGWPRWTPSVFLIEQPDHRLYDDMRALYEDFPTRFLLGTDIAHTPLLYQYPGRILVARRWLEQLSPATARRLAYENAEALLIHNRSISQAQVSLPEDLD